MTTDVAAAVVNRRLDCVLACMSGECIRKCAECEFNDSRDDVVLAYTIALSALGLAYSLGMPGMDLPENVEEKENVENVDSV